MTAQHPDQPGPDVSIPSSLSAADRASVSIASVRLVVGLEIHVELATRRKMFAGAPSPGIAEFASRAPNTCIDPTVLALPGSLPVMNKQAIELSIRVGLALGCGIAERPVWDRKGYVYPDLPKAYQLSQYALPLCFDGAFDLPPVLHEGTADHSGDGFDTKRHSVEATRIRIRRAHLEEDAGKLLHEAPGGREIGYSIVDLNRAGTALLEIVTEPDFQSGAQAEAFCRELRRLCRHVGATEGDMQKGHVRFEPNINVVLTLGDGAFRGRVVRTPITEVKNLNSFRSVRGAIEYELKHQPERWREDGREFGPATKTTRGWDDARLATFVQREKEDEQDYRYFPDPDLPPARVPASWVESIRAELPELPSRAMRRAVGDSGLSPREAEALIDEPEVARFYESAVDACVGLDVDRSTAGLRVAKLLLQSGQRRANERVDAGEDVTLADLGVLPAEVGELVALRESGAISADGADELFGVLCGPDVARDAGAGVDLRTMAASRGLLVVRDAGLLDAWCQQAIDEQPTIASEVRDGKLQAVGRLIGAVKQISGGAADAKAVRARLLEILGDP